MIRLEVSTDMGRALVVVGHVADNWTNIRRDSAFEVSRELKGKVYDWILSSGEGTWPKFHPMTRAFVLSRAGASSAWRRRTRFLGQHNWNWLSQFVTSYVDKRGERAVVRFGRSKTSAFRSLEERAVKVEMGKKTSVSPNMRRMFGATRNVLHGKNPEAGVDFFPLRGETGTLELKPHPIMLPVFQREISKVASNFDRAFERNYERYERQAR